MKIADIRESYLSFFEQKGCERRPSSSLIPDDPSLLLTSAGMVQFKPVFLGAVSPGYTRATTCQKCVRTTDIDIIGTTGRHLSFFEMLGNFSFGDYFKREAITWAWEYSTKVLGLDPERIWATVYLDDDEAYDLWLELTDIPAERIRRLGEADNFWAAGPTGPCGPCSELYYDQGESFACGSPDCGPGCDCDRYLEYWNLVFMQYNRDEAGVLTPLPKQNIDTGMGLERIAAILQGVRSNYETDLLRGIMALAEELTGRAYGTDERTDIALRIIADHARSVTFMIADGILPGNEGRGYVLRRLLRRAVRYGRLLGTEEPFMVTMVEKVILEMAQAYPELAAHRDLIAGIVAAEEERFGATLRTGTAFLEQELARLGDGEVISGVAAFTLHDTYGFPIDLTVELAGEAGVSVDLEGFGVEMEQQKSRARAHVKDESWSTYGGTFSDIARERGATHFLGYDHDEAPGTVVAIVVDGHAVESAPAGTEVEIVLDETPFYGERGGQVGDSGTLSVDGGATVTVVDSKIREGVLVSHVGTIESGALSVGDRVNARIDVARRERIRRNHTAAHLLHWALRLIVGTHATQAGSFVSADRMRFDFTHFEALTSEQLERIERMVNSKIFEDHPARAYETSLDTARESGVTALFGEKYGEFVRVLEVGNFSKELCGGTHVGRTAEIGFFKITSESSVGANVRRIEAVTSYDAYEYTSAMQSELVSAAAALGVSRRDVAERVSALLTKVKALESQAKRGASAPSTDLDALAAQAAPSAGGYTSLVADLGSVATADLKSVWDALRDRKVEAAVLFGTDPESGKVAFVAAGSDVALAAGFDAGATVKSLAAAVGGRGGGKAAMAQGGVDDASKIAAGLAHARAELGL